MLSQCFNFFWEVNIYDGDDLKLLYVEPWINE